MTENKPLAWLAIIVFFTFYFVAWCVKELPHTRWVTMSAITAIVAAALLLFDNGRRYL